MAEVLLEVRHLTTVFEDELQQVVAIDGVSFNLSKGEVIGIVGESGCGKSVTSLSVARLIEKTGGKIVDGEILFKGQDLVKKNAKEMRQINGNQIAMIFQEPMSSLNPLLTIGRQLREVIMRHKKVSKKEAHAQAIHLLELVGIQQAERRIEDYPFQLSGGQRQRVMIAIALSCNPDLLIADEPTTALDVTIQAQILDLMKALQQEMGMSIMLITHDLGVVADMAQRVVVMYGGQVVEEGKVQEIFANPLHPYTKGLLQAMPTITKSPGRLYMIPGSVSASPWQIVGCRFAARCEWCTDICQQQPMMTAVSESRHVRCWHYGKEGANGGENFAQSGTYRQGI